MRLRILVFIMLMQPGLWLGGHCMAEDAGLVVLLHGLARSPGSMDCMAKVLEKSGYRVLNLGYPSRRHTVEDLAEKFVAPAIAEFVGADPRPVHFVTHSMGGIIVRQLKHSGAWARIGRVVMLAPPNQGSEVVDKLGDWRLFRTMNGPAGLQLGTGPAHLPQQLGPATFELGVIAATRSINPLLSLLIPGVNDGKVSVPKTKLDGMRDFTEVRATHPLIMRNRGVQEQVLHFLEHGKFKPVLIQHEKKI